MRMSVAEAEVESDLEREVDTRADVNNTATVPWPLKLTLHLLRSVVDLLHNVLYNK